MTACIKLSGTEASISNVEIEDDGEFDDSLQLAYGCHATGIEANHSLLASSDYAVVSDSTFQSVSDLTGDGTLISNCRFTALTLTGDDARVIGVIANGALSILGDDNVVLGYKTTSTVTIDVGADRTRYGANEGTLTDNSSTTIYLDNGMIVKDVVFTATGTLTDSTTGTVRVYTKTARTITGCFASVAGAPVTNPAVFDVHKDGVTIYTTQANRPDVAASANVGDVEVPDVTAWAAGSYLTVDVDTASSATDLTMTVQYTEA